MTGSKNDFTDEVSEGRQESFGDRPLASVKAARSTDRATADDLFTPDASVDQRPALRSWRRRLAIGFLVFLAIAGTRWPLRTTYLATFDAANFTFALDDFSPAYHRPQPPGYPLFVALSRVLQTVIPEPEKIFPAAGILGSALAVVLLFQLGNIMFGRPAGICAAALLTVHPALWFAGVMYPVRVYLAAGSAAVALLCWLALRLPQQQRWFWYAGAAMGISAGFRPELLLFLSPVALLAVLAAHRRGAALVSLTAAVLLTAAAWLWPMAQAFGGLGPMLQFFTDYLRERSAESLVLGANLEAAAPHWLLALQWTFLPALAWIWAVPFVRSERTVGLPSRWIFVACWLLPGFLFHALVHIHHPDQALAAAPPLCLLGGWAISQAHGGRNAIWRSRIRAAFVAVALTASTFLFWERLDWAPRATGYLGYIEWMEDMSRATIEEIRESKREAPGFLISANSEVPWRVLQHYFPEQTLIVLPGDLREDPPPQSEVWFLRNNNMEQHLAAAEPIPLPAHGRGIWIAPMAEAVVDLLAAVPGGQRTGPVWSSESEPGREFQVGQYWFVTVAGKP